MFQRYHSLKLWNSHTWQIYTKNFTKKLPQGLQLRRNLRNVSNERGYISCYLIAIGEKSEQSQFQKPSCQIYYELEISVQNPFSYILWGWYRYDICPIWSWWVRFKIKRNMHPLLLPFKYQTLYISARGYL